MIPPNAYQAQRRTLYTIILGNALARTHQPDVDLRHVEAYLRLEFGTLDALSRADLDALLPEVVTKILADPATAEKLAVSYGL